MTRWVTFVGALVLLLGTACRRAPPPRVERYDPTSDPGIELAKFDDHEWAKKGLRPMLRYSVGYYMHGFSGFHLDVDGTIWEWKYEPRAWDSGRCRAGDLREGSDEAVACWYENSKLVARLTQSELAALVRHTAAILDVETLYGGMQMTDSGGASLMLEGYGTRWGNPILIGACNPRQQHPSDEARYFAELFHRIGRVLPRFALSKNACGSPDRWGDEIVPGVRGWWLH